MTNCIINSDIVDFWLSVSSKNKIPEVYKFIKGKIGDSSLEKEVLLRKIKLFDNKIKKYWSESRSNRQFFDKKYSKWLNWKFFDPDNEPSTSKTCQHKISIVSDIEQLETMESSIASDMETNVSHTTNEEITKSGRKKKVFSQSSVRSKNRKISELIENYSFEELQYAADKLRKRCNNNLDSTKADVKCISIEKSLALYMDLDLSERKYNVLREAINEIHPNCLPSLYALRNEKLKFLPPIATTEISAEVDLKCIMCKTAESVIKICNMEQKCSKLSLICKWGMDGSSGHSRYKQKFEIENSSDEFIFFIAFVPLRLVNLDSKEVLWVNKTPSSTMYCRPLKFVLTKENPVLVKQMHNDFIEEFKNLECSVIDTNGSTVEVSYDMHCTMIDGSVANVLSDTNSASRCFICNASPTDMNNINIIKDPCINNYKYGLSTLHCWIRFFECILHIAYRLPLKVWRVNKENTSVFSQNKKKIQNEFKTRTGLIIDQVKTGFGTTNDGNTARRFFENSEISAEITGIDRSLIDNFGIILRVLSCGIPVNVTTFKELLNITRNSYLIQYGWYYMPSTVHKVLVHGCDVLEYFNLPIGCLSEEALEASHKNIRNVRLSHTRKTTRENTNRDLMAHLLLMSDPELSSLRSTRHIKKMTNSKKLRNTF